MEELELMFEDEAGIYLPQVVAEENKRKANEHERLSSEEERLANEKERVENEEYRKNTMKEIETKTDAIIDEMNANLRKISFVRRYKAVHTAEENQDTFSIPSEYTETSMLDIHVNGFTLNDTQYSINSTDLTVTLVDPVDAGTTVEIVVTRLTTAHIEDYNSLFYDDTEIKEGLEENTADIQSNEDRIIALEAENIKQKEQIEYLEKVRDQALKDHKKIPFNAVSNHLQDTGELPILDLGINGGIEQDTREGYNHLPILDVEEKTINGVTYSIKNGVLTLNGTSTGGFDIWVSGTSKAPTMSLSSGEYTFCATDIKGTFTGTVGKYIRDTVTGTNIIDGNLLGYLAQRTLENDYSSLSAYIFVANGAVFTNYSCSLMLLSGKYTADTLPPFEQYGAMPSLDFPSEVKGVTGHYDTVVENKNIIPTDVSKWEGGHYATNGQKENYSTRMRLVDLLPIEPNTIYFASNAVNGISYLLRGFNKEKELVQNIGAVYNGKNTFTTNADVFYLGVSIDITYTDYVEETYQLFMCLNSETDKTFIEHQEQLLPIDIPFNMYSGKAYKENGKWYRKEEYKKYVFTGNENITLQTISNNVSRFDTGSIFKGKINTHLDVFCNYLKNDTTGLENTIRSGLDQFIETCVMYVNSSIASTVEEMKAYVKNLYDNGTPLYVIYKLATPTIEEITDTTLIAQLEELQKANSYYEVTNINSYGSEVPLVLSGNALMSNDIRLSKLESGV